jgi:hypothetical protein
VPSLRDDHRDETATATAKTEVPTRLLDPHVEDFIDRGEMFAVANGFPDDPLVMVEVEAARRYRREVRAWASSIGMDPGEARGLTGRKVGQRLPFRDIDAVVALVGVGVRSG